MEGRHSVNDLISRAALLKECEERQKSNPLEDGRGWADHFLNDAQCPSTEWNSVGEMIEGMPAVDAVPVVHGLWIYFNCVGNGRYQCSECFHWVDAGTDRNYCPNCGAKNVDGDA